MKKRTENMKILISLLLYAFLQLKNSFACHPSKFQCSNGKCYPRKLVCDSFDHCGDNSDEAMCDPFACHPSAFQCLSGKCLSRDHFCAWATQCDDYSDEKYCRVRNPAQCPRNWTLCPSGQRCIPDYWICDGFPDCLDGAEERNCVNNTVKMPVATTMIPILQTVSTSTVKTTARSSVKTTEASSVKTTEALSVKTTEASSLKTTEALAVKTTEALPVTKTETSSDFNVAKAELKFLIFSRRKPNSGIDRWGSQVHRIAVALHLADNSTFGTGHGVGEEIRYELTTQLLRRLGKDKRLNSQELALYIHALLVSCMNPTDFYGDNLVMELRKRVEASRDYTNPFLILALCNAGAAMTERDVDRVTASYDSHHRPFWTDYQALSSMALSCISARSRVSVDERVLKDMLQDLKRRQFRNGTVDNYRTTALVTQALFIHDSYKKDFDLDSALKVLTNGVNASRPILDAYYALPVFHRKSLLNVTSDHCRKEPEAEEEALQKILDVVGETMSVQYSVWMGDEVNLARTWRLRVRVNSTIYDAIETVAKIDNRQKVEYNVVDGKPFVSALNGKEDDPELGMLWFVYLNSPGSDKDHKMVEQSPVDVKLKNNQEIILWYKRGPWSEKNTIQKPETSS